MEFSFLLNQTKLTFSDVLMDVRMFYGSILYIDFAPYKI